VDKGTLRIAGRSGAASDVEKDATEAAKKALKELTTLGEDDPGSRARVSRPLALDFGEDDRGPVRA